MTKYQINCVLRVLSELCFKQVSANEDDIIYHDHCWPSRRFRFYECWEDLCLRNGYHTPNEMTTTEFVKLFMNIDINEASLVVRDLSHDYKIFIGDLILYMCQADMMFNAFNEEMDVLIINKIVTSCNICSENINRAIQKTKQLKSLV